MKISLFIFYKIVRFRVASMVHPTILTFFFLLHFSVSLIFQALHLSISYLSEENTLPVPER